MKLKNVYFVPIRQDSPVDKPRSMIADFNKTEEAIIAAVNNKQIQPIIF